MQDASLICPTRRVSSCAGGGGGKQAGWQVGRLAGGSEAEAEGDAEAEGEGDTNADDRFRLRLGSGIGSGGAAPHCCCPCSHAQTCAHSGARSWTKRVRRSAAATTRTTAAQL